MKVKTIKHCLVLPLFFMILLVSPCPGNTEPTGIPEELKGIPISDQFLKGTSREVGTIKQIKGKGRLVVFKRTEKKACYAAEGDPVYERDTLYTTEDCRCRIEFTDRNVIVLAGGSHLDIDEVYASLIQSVKRSRFAMNKGKAIFYALRLFRYKEMQLDLKTPTASIGVRGTKFGAEIERRGGGNPQEEVLTRAYVFEGEIDVTSLVDGRVQRLRENEILEAGGRGLGGVVSDPGKTRSFMEEVLTGIAEIPAPESRILRDEFRREELDRMDRMDDVRQKQMETPVHEIPSTGGHNR